MAQVFDIPIIARGRVIMPGDDGVHYKGRGGADFRQADPHKHIHDLVLGDTSRMRDLHDTPMAQIIDLLAELGKRLHLDDNALLQESFALALKAGGLAEPILHGVYDALPRMFDPAMMTALVDKTIGLAYLDGWVASGGDYESVSIRAVGTRQLHITAGNVPVVAAMTIARAGLTKSDILIKSPSNDPLTANAIARTLIEIAPDHPVTKHVAVAYWKGGDDYMDSQVIRTSRIDKITAWGGMSSVKHIQKFLTPGIDLTALNPKYSMSMIGRATFASEAAVDEAAVGLATLAGFYNQTACANTRIVYVESGTDDASIEQVVVLGRKMVAAYASLPPLLSTPFPTPNRELEAEMAAIALEDDFYHVEGDTLCGGFIVSKFNDRVEFYDKLNNRVVNFVPVDNLTDVLKWCDDTTQTVGIYPESVRSNIVDLFALAGIQRLVSLAGGDPLTVYANSHHMPPGSPHDGIEPMRRSMRWVVNMQPVKKPEILQIAAE
ncbi:MULTISPECIES: acyl-CoA reductase [unclassified Novosphingobium]|uniref:acyl-CoA reductase n=1 Tax=unclassified Novosphingobium TaxID=2644732 RepID=UPI00135BB790|nr:MULTISPECIES: acyl-CoA reductase [unclassified Novosphingobium]